MPSAQNNSANNRKKPQAGPRPCQHQFRDQGSWRVCTKCGVKKPRGGISK